jgi:uncharacterized membrane protein
MAILYGIISVAFAVWFTALIRARWSGGGPLLARAGRASYATYVLHPLALTAIMVLFASLALAPELKFLVVAVAAVPSASWRVTRRHGCLVSPRYCYRERAGLTSARAGGFPPDPAIRCRPP